MDENIQLILDKVESLDKKLLGFEGILNFTVLGLESLNQAEDSYEVGVVQSLYSGIRAVRKSEVEELRKMLEHMRQ